MAVGHDVVERVQGTGRTACGGTSQSKGRRRVRDVGVPDEIRGETETKEQKKKKKK